jgi:hypothetical protein
MTQQYGFRAARNLAEVQNQNDCIDNLGIDRRDLALLVGTSAAGVTEADYQAIIGLSSNLEQQIVALSSGATVSLSGISARASRLGDTFTGAIFADAVNNDRPYTTQSGVIIGPSTVSYFSPSASGLFSSGGEYKLGPVTAATIQSSGINYTGTLTQWSSQFVRYKNFLQLQEQPSWTVRRVPLFLPPPTAISGCTIWLDAEFSEFILGSSGRVIQWKGVDGGPVARQGTTGPSFVANVLNGKPAVRFDGFNDILVLGNLGYLAPTEATVVVVARVDNGFYNIFGTLNNSGNRWNNGTGVGDLGMFTTTLQNGFPSQAQFDGTFVFSVRISQSFGLEFRTNGSRTDYKATGFTYTGGDTWIIGQSAGATGRLTGDIYSLAVFNRVLSDKEIRTAEEYLAWRYDAVYDPDRTQPLQLENFATIDLEDDTPIVLG